MRTRTSRHLAPALLALALLAGACSSGGNASPEPEAPASVDVAAHESNTDSPLGFGFTVPQGATQIGPLMRWRSDALLDAYQDELEAALIKQATDDAERSIEGAEDETPEPSVSPSPTPTATRSPYAEPRRDTFYLLEERPRTDSTTTFLRIDEDDPTPVFVALLTQVREILPDSDVQPHAWQQYCDTTADRIDHCSVNAQGTASNGLELSVDLSVDPGDIETRRAAPGAQRRPVVVLSVAYVGDPDAGQDETGRFERTDLPEPAEEPPADELVWPQMDVDQPAEGPLLDGKWTVPSEDARLLLSGFNPRFVVLHAHSGTVLEEIGRDWVKTHSDRGPVDRDVIEDLNEFTTVYTANSSKKGLVARAAFIQSARGTYLLMTFTPGG